jgi:hypothetical protein
MAEFKKDREKLADRSESSILDTHDKNLTGVVTASEVKDVHSSNSNAHSGSAGGDQEHSLEIVGFGTIISRQNPLTSKSFETNDKVIAPELSLKATVSEISVTPQAVFERISLLSNEEQAVIISAGVMAYWDEINRQQYEIFIGTASGAGRGIANLVDSALKLGEYVGNFLEFGREWLVNDPIADQKITDAGKSLGCVLVGGIRVFELCDNYLSGLGAASYNGDQAKVLRDLSALGREINRGWESMTPAERASLASKCGVEYLGSAYLGAGVSRLAKTTNLTPALHSLGVEFSSVGSAGREKCADYIGALVEGALSKRREIRIAELARTGRDLAGKPFGGWPVVGERECPTAVKQFTRESCVSACGQMLSDGRLLQASLVERLGAPVDCRKLAQELGPEWSGHYTDVYKDLDSVMQNGPWCATLFDRYARGLPHAVVVDGASAAGNIIVRDPWEGTVYEMTREAFVKYWTGCAVFRK